MKTLSKTGIGKTYRSKRYRTDLPTTVNGVSGVTHNVSATGLYILQDQQCETGSRIDFLIDLATPGGQLKLCCEGEVVRVDKVDHRLGIGVKMLSQVIKAVN